MMKKWLIFLIILLFSNSVYSQTLENKHHRILILLDASLSMNERAEGYTTKYAVASDFIIGLMDSVYRRNDEVEFGLRVNGHQYPASARQCFDTKLEVQFSRNNIEQMGLRLRDIKPRGLGSIAEAFQEAAGYDLVNTDGYYYHFLIISDSAGKCGRNLCDAIQSSDNKKIKSVCLLTLNERYKSSCSNTTYVLVGNNQHSSVIKSLLTECCIVPILSRKQKEEEPKHLIAINTPAKIYDQSDISQLSARSAILNRTSNFKPTFQPQTVPEYNVVVDGMGFLRIANMLAIKDIKLFYEEKDTFTELTKLKIESLYTGQRIQLLTGKYRIEYTIKIGERFGKRSLKNITIQRNMITDLVLN